MSSKIINDNQKNKIKIREMILYVELDRRSFCNVMFYFIFTDVTLLTSASFSKYINVYYNHALHTLRAHNDTCSSSARRCTINSHVLFSFP